MSNNEITTVEFLLKGKMFNENNTSLHDLILAYSSFEAIIDTTYANIIGIDRFSRYTRDSYGILLKETHRGSWNSLLDIFVVISPLLFTSPLTPKDLLETAKATYEFVKCAYTLKQKGDAYEIHNNGAGIVQVNASGNQYNFNAPVTINLIGNAKEILPDIKQFADLIKKDSLSELVIRSKDLESPMELSKSEKNLFDLPENTISETKEISVELYRYNKRSRTGKLQVHPSQAIDEGKYSFFVKKENIQDELIMSMLETSTTIIVKEYFIENPLTGENDLQSLEILDI